jgi:predicted DNA-binding transcriptional regulator AlpA
MSRDTAHLNASDEDMLPSSEVSMMLGLSLAVLKKLRKQKKGPRFYRLSHRTVRYRRADVLAWLADRASPSTDARPS